MSGKWVGAKNGSIEIKEVLCIPPLWMLPVRITWSASFAKKTAILIQVFLQGPKRGLALPRHGPYRRAKCPYGEHQRLALGMQPPNKRIPSATYSLQWIWARLNSEVTCLEFDFPKSRVESKSCRCPLKNGHTVDEIHFAPRKKTQRHDSIPLKLPWQTWTKSCTT